MILIINFIFGSDRLWPTSFNSNMFSVILELNHVILLVPSTLGVNVSQAQRGSPQLDQTQGFYLESVALKNRQIHNLVPNVI